jgi:apolipoprotein N-acyltransferase
VASVAEALSQRRGRLIAGFLIGALASLIFAPFHFFPAGFLAFGGLIWLLDRCANKSQAFWTGWFFGWGHFIAGLYWIASAFLVEPEKFAWMIPFPLLGLPAVLAVFAGVATLLTWKIAPAGPARILALAASWTLMELARGTVLTGFPWNLTGYAWGLDTTTMQAASWIGIYGMSFLAVVLFAAPALFLGRDRNVKAATVLLVFPLLVAASAAPRVLSDEGDKMFSVRLVQGNIEQKDKWRPERIESNFQHLTALSAHGEAVPDLVIWPETAATFLLSTRPDKLNALGSVAALGSSGILITGAPRLAGEQIYNSAVAVNSSGEMISTADKHHLVPFGEYLPLRPLLQAIGLEKLAQGRGDFSTGGAQQILKLQDLPDAAILICYEAIFPSLAARDDRPGWLLNLTNDGWFGELTGPDQHFAMARFRAVEQGLGLVRAAGTGISAVVTPSGEITGIIPLGESGTIDLPVVRSASPTLFSLTGSLPVVAACLLLMVALLLKYRRLLGR